MNYFKDNYFLKVKIKKIIINYSIVKMDLEVIKALKELI